MTDKKNILDEIVQWKKQEVKRNMFYYPLTKFIKSIEKSKRNFRKAIDQQEMQIIAEIKRSSPSAGVLNKKFDHIKLAEIYNKHASAMSILTDEKFFKGKLEYLKDIDQISNIPLLRKDFIISEYQIYEARHSGADAILLIASLLTKDEINKYLALAKSYHMHCLVEVHDQKQLNKAIETNAEIIGINNRNLSDFTINLENTSNLAPHIDTRKTIVSESGINDTSDIDEIKDHADAILIGSSLMTSDDPEDLLKKLKKHCQKIDTKDKDKQLRIV